MPNTYPIVAFQIRPPATPLLRCLHDGAELMLVHELDNPYDKNAIKVVLATDTLGPDAHEYLAGHAPRFGYSLEDILAESEWDLGYIPQDMNADPQVRAARSGSYCMSDNKPAIKIPF